MENIKPFKTREEKLREMSSIRRLSTMDCVRPESVKIIEYRLEAIPSGVIVEAVNDFGEKQEIFISQYVGSDEKNGLTDDWKILRELEVI